MQRVVPWAIAAVTIATLAAPAFANRRQVYSLSGLHSVEGGGDIRRAVKKVKGVKKFTFDYLKAEMTVSMLDNVTDAQVLKAVARAGYAGEPGPGKGKYLEFDPYPANVDFAVLGNDGARIGSLDSLRVPGKYTIFDIYAAWCMPCRQMDMALHAALAGRDDVAIRRLNFVSWDSPLAEQMEGQVKALPHMVIFAPDGKSRVVEGFNPGKLQAALNAK